MNNVVIALISDENYIIPTVVLLQSLKDTKSASSFYDIHILTDNVQEASLILLKDYSCNNINVTIHQINNKYMDLHNNNDYVTNAAFIKFDIPNILSKYSKILYLDSDIIVLKDLNKIFDIDLENKYAAVVADVADIFYKKSKELQLNSYFNSGVILFNAEKYRTDKMNTKMLEIYKEHGESFICHDQDTLNIGFKENVVFLNPKYNFMQSFNEFPMKKVMKFYNMKNLLKFEDIFIIHYTRLKPWKYKHINYGRKWHLFYKNTIFKNEPLGLKSALLFKAYFYLIHCFNFKSIHKLIKKYKNIKG